MAILIPDRIDIFVHNDNAPSEAFQTSVLNSLEFLKNQGAQLMTTVSDAIAAYAAKSAAFMTEIGADLDALAANVATLQTTISTLQSTPPVLAPGDQTLLDQIQQQASDLASKADAIAGKTPPPPPPAVTNPPAA